MNSHVRIGPVIIGFCIFLVALIGQGQSLSLTKDSESTFSIIATAPSDTSFVLQESANLHLWVDVADGISASSTNRFANTGAPGRFFRLQPSAPPAPPIVVVLLGDSTVADYSGWGYGIYGYFKPNVQVVNLAAPWQSTGVFLASDQKATMLKIKPNYVLAAYGAIDEYGSTGFSDTIQEFHDNLTTIVQLIRGFNGTPILVTPSAARAWDANGNVVPYLVERSAVVKQVASELQTPLIDLNQLSTDLFKQLGPTGTVYMTYTVIPNDLIHFSLDGAKTVSGLVVNALPDYFGPYLTGIFDPPLKP